MTYFSRKTSVVTLSFSIGLLVLSSLLVLFSNQLVDFAYEILSKYIFHREFSIDKWLSSIESFFLVPVFAVLFFNAIIFLKYPPKAKIIFLSSFLAVILFMILYTNYVATYMHVNSDLASELLLGKECVIEKSFWPKGWCYSTEIRLINTQFFSAFGFLFTDNFDAVKTIQSFFTCASIFFACWYLLNQLEIKKLWLKYLSCILIFVPWSVICWHVGAGENYYVPHAIFGIIYVATFIKLNNSKTISHPLALKVFFFVWAFLCGLSSIRYVIIEVLPLFFAVLFIETRDKTGAPITDFKKFWLGNRFVFTATAGVFLSGLGYAANNLVLQNLYYFSQWNSMSFQRFGKVTLSECFFGLLSVFGYNSEIAFFTPGGAINILIYIAFVLFVLYAFLSIRSGLPKSNTIELAFFISSMIFNTFMYVNIDYINRYYYPIVVHVIPCLACIISNSTLSETRKYCLGAVWAFFMCVSSYATISNRLNFDENTREYPVAEFLVQNGYHFGYATFGHSTIFTYLTKGKIEVGNLYKEQSAGSDPKITTKYKYDTWLTLKRYYEKDFAKGEKVFMLLTRGQYFNAINDNIVKNGKLVYLDDNFAVLEYESHDAFRNGF